MSQMAKKMRWGILGVAKINDRLMPAFKVSKTVELRAIASRDIERAKGAAQKDGIPIAYGSYEELLKDPEIDIVYNPLPNSLHDEWTRKAADHGKHILCEKPLCPTAKEAAELVKYCRSKNVKLMDGFMWPHHPRTHHLKKLIQAGAIGKVTRVSAAFTFKMDLGDTKNIRLHPQMGGGSLLDVGCYPIYGIRWAFGEEPVSVFARARMLNQVDLEMSGQLTFAYGRMASFDCGFTNPLRGWMEITGETGIIHVPEMWIPKKDATFELTRDGKEKENLAVSGEDQMVWMMDDLAKAITENREPYPSPEEAVKTLRVLDALAKSAKEGIEIKL